MKIELHAEIFSEEFDYMYDSRLDAADRSNGVSPMSEEYTAKINFKREKLGMSNLNSSGLPMDNSSEVYIENLILNHVLRTTKEFSNETKLKNQMNISSFFKNNSK
ncbi:hypothetical protein [Formosa sp. L2A11]|uniref:hypothetical protein n=1 Tax=Formosa sp. L2A11 TaxID=2686363 RepID=UPI00131DC0B1|nr:hypothetical protein [Formosa sp. L2A11]